MIQIVKKPSGARLVISIIILMSRWSTQLLTSLLVGSSQKLSITSINCEYCINISIHLFNVLLSLNRFGLSLTNSYSLLTSCSPMESPSSRNARRYSTGSCMLFIRTKDSSPNRDELNTVSSSSSARFLYLSSPVSPLHSNLTTIYSYNNRF
jgi:hypothetical protein